jgi:winged helix-turn-helix protein/Homeodomain-like domain-containing protein
MARIIGHLSVDELEARYRAARDATEARHLQAIWLLAQGRTVLDVASVLAFAPRWVEQLAARYNAHGPAVLAALSERLREPPEDGGQWTGPKVARWMAARLGLATVHAQRGWEALKRLRWSIQAPRPRHPRSATPENLYAK